MVLSMNRILVGFLGIVGAIWFFQGINILPGSFMTGDIRWALAGIVAFGTALYLWRKNN